MVASWVIDEMKTVDLKDERLNRRLQEVLSQLASQPTASIPAACGGRAEMTAAYRLFDNDKATFDDVLEPHCAQARQRVAAQSVVLLVQDTTEIDVTRPDQQVFGSGPLDGGSRRGALLHVLHAFTPDGTPLGTLHARAWVRPEDARGASMLSRGQRAATPIEEKESHRWVVGLQHAAEEAADCPTTRFLSIADSEADIYEVLAEGVAVPRLMEWIVRASQNRALHQGEAYVREQILRQPVLFTQTIRLRGRKAKVSCETRGRRQPRESREATVEVRAGTVTLRAPQRGIGQ
jgi:Transposase DNA-binding